MKRKRGEKEREEEEFVSVEIEGIDNIKVDSFFESYQILVRKMALISFNSVVIY